MHCISVLLFCLNNFVKNLFTFSFFWCTIWLVYFMHKSFYYTFYFLDTLYNVFNLGKDVAIMKKFIALALVVCLVFAGGIGYLVSGLFKDDLTVISIDVNPSIQLMVDADGKVDEAIGVNADAKAIVDGLGLEGLELEAALDLVLGALVEENYISELANSILISVNNEDIEIAEKYEKLAVDTVNKLLAPLGTDINVISQVIDSVSGDVAKLAKELGISEGKAKFIADITAENDHLSAEALAEMSINDISLLVTSKAVVSPEGLEITGQANAKAYISESEALSSVLNGLGIPVEDIAAADVAFNFKNGTMAFDVSFVYGEEEINVAVDATTADILNVIKNPLDIGKFIEEGVDITVSEGIDESVKEIFGVTTDELIKDTVNNFVKEEVNADMTEEDIDNFIDKTVDEAIDKNLPSTGNEELDETIKDTAKDTANEVIDDTLEDIKQNGVTDDTIDNAIDNAVDKGVDNYLENNGITTGDPETDEALKDVASDVVKDAIANGTLDDLLGMLNK